MITKAESIKRRSHGDDAAIINECLTKYPKLEVVSVFPSEDYLTIVCRGEENDFQDPDGTTGTQAASS